MTWVMLRRSKSTWFHLSMTGEGLWVFRPLQDGQQVADGYDFERILDFYQSECQLLHMDALLEAHLPPADFNNSNQSLPLSRQTEGGDGAQCRLASRLVPGWQLGLETQNWNQTPAASWNTLRKLSDAPQSSTHMHARTLKDTLTVAASFRFRFMF